MVHALLKASIGYPDHASTLRILEGSGVKAHETEVPPVITAATVLDMARQARAVHVDPSVNDYVSRLIEATRSVTEVRLGVSVRGALALVRAAKTLAAASGRHYVVPDDVNTGRWTSELERYRRQWRRNRWLAPVVFGLFSVLSVVMAVSVGPVWLLFLVFFLGFLGFTLWQTRRGLRNTERALAELGRRRPSPGTPAAATPGATWTLPSDPGAAGRGR